jgi:uncharacterized damage-inducible protein DinB
MNLRKHCQLMARYHGWGFDRLYAEIDALDEDAYRRDTGLHFTSIHGTLNHLLLVDHVWHGRLVHEPFAIDSLRDSVEHDREALRARLLARPAVWLDYLAGLDDAELASEAAFRKLDGTPATLPRASCVLHVFNHGTHHRGQISAVLTQLDASAPEMDLPYFLYTLDPAELGA